ncbi:hypothetical protein EJB05_05866 [Eragrostis curvula]|uniref:Uncharacterized protein n=1 Tax=Eragrostis curvula TaxID=38414 RepID=A0A5J9WFZ8_9POAL|nr:hypothetical protein EJB05_05866 [Eragrostis curvula]
MDGGGSNTPFSGATTLATTAPSTANGLQKGDRETAIDAEVARLNKLPAHSSYAIHRMKVLNKLRHLLSIKDLGHNPHNALSERATQCSFHNHARIDGTLPSLLTHVLAAVVILVYIPLSVPVKLILRAFRKPHGKEDLKGKVVLITGASSGIGEELAYQYAKERACLALVGRRKLALNGVATAAQERGSPDVLVLPADVTDPEQSRRVVQETVAHFGKRHFRVRFKGMAAAAAGAAAMVDPASLLRRILAPSPPLCKFLLRAAARVPAQRIWVAATTTGEAMHTANRLQVDWFAACPLGGSAGVGAARPQPCASHAAAPRSSD